MSQVVASLVAKIGADTSGFEKGSQSVVSSLVGMAGKFLVSAAAIDAVTSALKFSIAAAAETQMVDAQLAAVLESTGGAAGMSAAELDKMATALSKVSVFDDEAVKSSESLLLTFTKVGSEVFPQATQAILDMSQALGQDLQASTMQLGKALNDPIAGLTALKRVGVQFTESQRDMIKTLVESGDIIGAQKIILAELNTEFGGSAQAAANTYTGQMKQLGNEVGELGAAIGKDLLPDLIELTTSVKDATVWITDNYEAIKKWGNGIAWVINPLGKLAMLIGQAANSGKDQIDVVDNTTLGYMKQAAQVEALTEYYRKNNKEVPLTIEEQENLEKAMLKVEEAAQSQRESMVNLAMDLTTSNQEYAKSQADIQTQIADLTAEKASMYSWEVKDIETIQGKIDDLSKKYNENAEEHSKRTQQIILDMTLEKIAMSDGIAGFNEAEAARALAVAETAGAVEAAAIREAVAMDQISTAMADPNQKLLDMKMLLESMVANGWNINVAVIMQGLENLQGMTGRVQPNNNSGRRQAMAGGGSFTVPPEYGYEGFALGGMATATAGERVTVGTAANNTDNSAAMAAMIAGSMPTERGIGRAVARELQKAGMGATR
jgi:hypothetical protein